MTDVCCLQGLPAPYKGWALLDAQVAALAVADSVPSAVEAMRALPALYSAALLPRVMGVPLSWPALEPSGSASCCPGLRLHTISALFSIARWWSWTCMPSGGFSEESTGHVQSNVMQVTSRMSRTCEVWLHSEEVLLGRAMMRFGKDKTAKAHTYFLPNREEADIAACIRRRTTHRTKDNPVQARLANLP